MTTLVATPRGTLLQRALRLEYLTVGWNLVEGVIAVSAAVAAGSVALLGFGLDSFIESASGAVLIWRLRAEQTGTQDPGAVASLDERAHRLVGISLFVLAAYVAVDALATIYQQERPDSSLVGIVLTSLSLGVMLWLAKAKRRAAHQLRSRAMKADAFQTTACWWLSVIVLGGIGLNALFGWWWADPLAALGMAWFLVKEGREAWQGDDCCE